MRERAGETGAARTERGIGRARPVLGYAAVGAGVALLAAAFSGWLAPDAARAIAVATAVAYVIQLVAFTALWALRERTSAFFLAWGGGTLLRFGAVLGVGFWLASAPAVPAAPMLLSFVAVLFVLLLLETLFFRAGIHAG